MGAAVNQGSHDFFSCLNADKPDVCAMLQVYCNSFMKAVGTQEAQRHLFNIGKESNFKLISIATQHVACCRLLFQNTGPNADLPVADIERLRLQNSSLAHTTTADTA